MTPEEFICKHITEKLVAEGFPEIVAREGGLLGLDYYRRSSQASRKGGIFDDCYFRARQWALGQTTVTERKEKPGRIKVGQPGLF
ncbi:hypothetical protein E0V34_08895 [Escherichia coli]|nr:hypothetical protein [Escherichia coli]